MCGIKKMIHISKSLAWCVLYTFTLFCLYSGQDHFLQDHDYHVSVVKNNTCNGVPLPLVHLDYGLQSVSTDQRFRFPEKCCYLQRHSGLQPHGHLTLGSKNHLTGCPPKVEINKQIIFRYYATGALVWAILLMILTSFLPSDV